MILYIIILILPISSLPIAKQLNLTDRLQNIMSEIEQEQINLNNQRDKFLSDKARFTLELLEMSGNTTEDDLIYLNVGGELMTTTRSTLTLIPDSKLYKLFNGRWNDKLVYDKNNFVFLDYDPILFKHLLNQLRLNRTSTFTPPPLRQQKEWKEFLGLLDISHPSDFVIKLNVRDEYVTTLHSTLTVISDSKLAQMFNDEDGELFYDQDGNVFLDVNPKWFKHLHAQLKKWHDTENNAIHPPPYPNANDKEFIDIMQQFGLTNYAPTTANPHQWQRG
ncbi:unnamed protein product [Didymodactylos carnosus]|uniref:Potassium channel tetramerisation-type BTB domain-containing protein n=1 Tax=Didymodactylos carnosus TaxID=1234261 RepID=A0A815CH04_9BILA|nr:unnamed protein product [Didymodactylos carnosus]CAF1283524.1 unnamed protein product [Didymodactylos carnosus]CAF3840691.1 unnamed protein product [Didymodactylos carnosus]CAF4080993.1 unnamed protein product [Didymodactylos carnosus]